MPDRRTGQFLFQTTTLHYKCSYSCSKRPQGPELAELSNLQQGLSMWCAVIYLRRGRSSGSIPRDSKLVSRKEHSGVPSLRILIYMTTLGYMALSGKVQIMHIFSLLCVVKKRWWITITFLGQGMVTPVFFRPPQAGRGISIIPVSWGLRAMPSLQVRWLALYGDLGNLFKRCAICGDCAGVF